MSCFVLKLLDLIRLIPNLIPLIQLHIRIKMSGNIIGLGPIFLDLNGPRITPNLPGGL